MNPSDSSETQWGKLTSFDHHSKDLSLSKNPSIFVGSNGVIEDYYSSQTNFPKYRCLVFKDQKGDFFICYYGDSLSIHIEDQILKEGEASKIDSDQKIVFVLKGQDENRMEYIFSSEFAQEEANIFKEDQEKNEEVIKPIKPNENLKNKTICKICDKTIYECVSVIPCLHSFCMNCLQHRLKSSQECPQCGKRFVEFCKDKFLNNIIEASEEKSQRERSEEKCGEISQRLEAERVLLARFEYASGDIYEGEWKKCRKDGRGKMTFRNGDVYEGYWNNNTINGKGKMLYANGDIYKGSWLEGQKNGRGQMVYHNGVVYQGDWKNDVFHGKGKFINTEGESYEGDWKNNTINGEGKMIYSHGDTYEGKWDDGQRCGGQMTFSNGSYYEGEWKYDAINGEGIMVYANGEIYQGNWKDFQRDGFGKLIKPEGAIFEGIWKDDVLMN